MRTCACRPSATASCGRTRGTTRCWSGSGASCAEVRGGDRRAAGLLEEVELRRVEPELVLLNLLDLAGRVEARDDHARSAAGHIGCAGVLGQLLELLRLDAAVLEREVHVQLGAERLDQVDLGLERHAL